MLFFGSREGPVRSDEGDPVPFKIPLARLWRLGYLRLLLTI